MHQNCYKVYFFVFNITVLLYHQKLYFQDFNSD